MNAKAVRKTPKPNNITIYLGTEPDKTRRKVALDVLAKELGYENKSGLIQAIADGRLRIVTPST